MFDRRNGPMGIIFTSAYISGQPMKMSVRQGDTVELRIGDTSIDVGAISLTENRSYKGKIKGFGPRPQLEFNGLRIGHEVEFSDDQIFAYTGPV